MTDIIAVASSKGGVGKTTTTFSLAAAAAAEGSALVIDLDPSISLTTQMQLPITGPNIVDVLRGAVAVEDALTVTRDGILAIAGSRESAKYDISADALRSGLGAVVDSIDTLIIDTRPALDALAGPMRMSTRIVIPTYLDGVSMPVTADTVHLALELGVADRISGVLATNVRRPLTRLSRDLYESLQNSGVGLEAVVWNSVRWPTALASGGLSEFPELMDAAMEIFREVLKRTAPVTALKLYAEAWRKTE